MAAVTSSSNRHSGCGRGYKIFCMPTGLECGDWVGKREAETLSHPLSLLPPLPQMSLAGGDPLPTQRYTSLLPGTEDSGAQKVQSRQTDPQHEPCREGQPTSSTLLSSSCFWGQRQPLSFHPPQTCCCLLGDPRSPSSPGEELRAPRAGVEMEHPSHLHGQGTLSSTPYHPLAAPPSPWETQPPLHLQHLSLRFLRSLPLCLQFLLLLLSKPGLQPPTPAIPSPTCQSPGFTSHAYLRVHVESPSLSPEVPALGGPGAWLPPLMLSITVSHFPPRGKAGNLNSVSPSSYLILFLLMVHN